MIATYQLQSGTSHGLIQVSDSGVVIGAEHPFAHLYGRLFANVQEWAQKAKVSLQPIDPPEKP